MGSSVEERELQLKKVYDKHFVLHRHELFRATYWGKGN
jgi:hypothetical protein